MAGTRINQYFASVPKIAWVVYANLRRKTIPPQEGNPAAGRQSRRKKAIPPQEAKPEPEAVKRRPETGINRMKPAKIKK